MSEQYIVGRAPGRAVHWEYLLPIATVHVLACLAVLPWCFSWSGLVLTLVAIRMFRRGKRLRP